MKIKVALEQGCLPVKYGRAARVRINDQPVVSFPIQLNDLPRNTEVLAVTLLDWDAVPRTGFPFIHWLATDIPVTTEIPVDFSRQYVGPQGINSWGSRFYHADVAIQRGYAGPNPPGEPHTYTLTVYALTQPTQLQIGFYANALRRALHNRVLAQASLEITVKN